MPFDEPVNVCTAHAHVLNALLNNGQTQYDDAFLKTQRDANGCFPTKQVYLTGVTGQQQTILGTRVDQRSSWFRLRTNIRIGTAEFVLYSLLYREPATNKTRTLQRSFGSE